MEINASLSELIQLFNNNKLGHAYLFETNNISKCLDELKYVINCILCVEKFEENCIKCSLCHLIETEQLSDLIVIKPENKTIKKDAIDNLKRKFSLKSMYTSKKIYIIISPEKMNTTAFNKMLKFLEEPEDNIIGFFITKSKDNVASTIVSRCEKVKIIYDDVIDDFFIDDTFDKNSLIELSDEFIQKITDKTISYEWFNENVKIALNSREEVVVFMQMLYAKLSKNQSKLVNKIILKVLQKYLMQLNYNVNINLMLNSFFVEVGDLNGN